MPRYYKVQTRRHNFPVFETWWFIDCKTKEVGGLDGNFSANRKFQPAIFQPMTRYNIVAPLSVRDVTKWIWRREGVAIWQRHCFVYISCGSEVYPPLQYTDKASFPMICRIRLRPYLLRNSNGKVAIGKSCEFFGSLLIKFLLKTQLQSHRSRQSLW